MGVKVPRVSCRSFTRQRSGCEVKIEKLWFNKRGIVYRQFVSRLVLQSPVMGKRYLITIGHQTKGVVKMVLFPCCRVCLPVDELHRALETSVAAAHPFIFRKSQEVEKDWLEVWHCRLTDAYLGNVRRLNDGDVHTWKCFFHV